MNSKVDVLAVMDATRDFIVEGPASERAWRTKNDLIEARAAVAELIETARDMLSPAYRGPDQERLRVAIACVTGV